MTLREFVENNGGLVICLDDYFRIEETPITKESDFITSTSRLGYLAMQQFADTLQNKSGWGDGICGNVVDTLFQKYRSKIDTTVISPYETKISKMFPGVKFLKYQKVSMNAPTVAIALMIMERFYQSDANMIYFYVTDVFNATKGGISRPVDPIVTQIRTILSRITNWLSHPIGETEYVYNDKSVLDVMSSSEDGCSALVTTTIDAVKQLFDAIPTIDFGNDAETVAAIFSSLYGVVNGVEYTSPIGVRLICDTVDVNEISKSAGMNFNETLGKYWENKVIKDATAVAGLFREPKKTKWSIVDFTYNILFGVGYIMDTSRIPANSMFPSLKYVAKDCGRISGTGKERAKLIQDLIDYCIAHGNMTCEKKIITQGITLLPEKTTK